MGISREENLDRAYEIVKDYFYLSKESLSRFKESLYKPFIDPIFKDHIDEDLRCRSTIRSECLSVYDISWSSFRRQFSTFYRHYGITYGDYSSGLVTIDKNKVKLLKAISNFYMSDMKEKGEDAYYPEFGNVHSLYLNEEGRIEYIQKLIRKTYENLTDSKLFKGRRVELVLSFNFVDWLMCSTGESWTSCLNLNSNHEEAFWAGLPGLLADKNRAMLYVSDGKTKKHEGLEAEKCRSRSWVELDDANRMHILKYYPKRLIDLEVIKETFKFVEWKDFFYDSETKYNINMLDFENGDTCFPYVDGMRLNGEKNKAYFVEGDSGYQGFDKNGRRVDTTPFIIHDGLQEVINSGSNLGDFIGNNDICDYCETRIMDGDSFAANDYTLCETCFNENFFYCEQCDEVYSIDDMNEVEKSNYHTIHLLSPHIICDNCFDLKYKHCYDCDSAIKIENALEDPNGDYFCFECFHYHYFICDDCGDAFEKDKMSKVIDNLCETCVIERKELEEEIERKRERAKR